MVKREGPLVHAVECTRCHASTTRYRLQIFAVNAWNRRGPLR
jgi:hypothetical protein